MSRFVLALLIFAAVSAPIPPAAGQDLLPSVDLLYPQFAHPQRDALAAIKHRDYRFIAVDRQRQIVPGLEHNARMKAIYHTKYVRQPFRLFPSRSQNFSFDLRARAYADEYNRTLLHYLLRRHRKK